MSFAHFMVNTSKRSLLTLPRAIWLAFLWLYPTAAALSLPPPEEVPEEILRTEVILEARSPLTGEPLSAADYAALQAELQDKNDVNLINTDVQQFIFLLQLRRGLRPFVPFIP